MVRAASIEEFLESRNSSNTEGVYVEAVQNKVLVIWDTSCDNCALLDIIVKLKRYTYLSVYFKEANSLELSGSVFKSKKIFFGSDYNKIIKLSNGFDLAVDSTMDQIQALPLYEYRDLVFYRKYRQLSDKYVVKYLNKEYNSLKLDANVLNYLSYREGRFDTLIYNNIKTSLKGSELGGPYSLAQILYWLKIAWSKGNLLEFEVRDYQFYIKYSSIISSIELLNQSKNLAYHIEEVEGIAQDLSFIPINIQLMRSTSRVLCLDDLIQ